MSAWNTLDPWEFKAAAKMHMDCPNYSIVPHVYILANYIILHANKLDNECFTHFIFSPLKLEIDEAVLFVSVLISYPDCFHL